MLQLLKGLDEIRKDKSIALLGAMQALFEGAMYTCMHHTHMHIKHKSRGLEVYRRFSGIDHSSSYTTRLTSTLEADGATRAGMIFVTLLACVNFGSLLDCPHPA